MSTHVLSSCMSCNVFLYVLFDERPLARMLMSVTLCNVYLYLLVAHWAFSDSTYMRNDNCRGIYHSVFLYSHACSSRTQLFLCFSTCIWRKWWQIYWSKITKVNLSLWWQLQWPIFYSYWMPKTANICHALKLERKERHHLKKYNPISQSSQKQEKGWIYWQRKKP